MTSHSSEPKTAGQKYVYILQQFSLPLLAGVVAALIVANLNPQLYDKLVHGTYAYFTGEDYHGHGHSVAGHDDDHSHEDGDHSHDDGTDHDDGSEGDHPEDGAGHDDSDGGDGSTSSEDGDHSDDDHSDDDHSDDGHADDEHDESAHGDDHGGHHNDWRHFCTLHFIINDLFMVIFFGIACKEITESCLPGGALNPPSKAINPLLGTIGGVVGPAGVYILLNLIMGDGSMPWEEGWGRGWGIPTATDIALAWLIARMVFGDGHPAISFLLLLAVADDGIGLLIIAFFYPSAEPEWFNVLWLVPGMIVAFVLRMRNVRSWVPYIVIGGAFSWWGLFSAHLHPALALVPIVPFLPAGKHDEGFFQEAAGEPEDNPLDRFEHDLKLFVDLGLFFFAFANAGVQFSNMNNLTWIVLLALLAGKTIGITGFSWVGEKMGFPMPEGMNIRHLVCAGVVAGLGLTVALFVAGQAFQGADQGAAKMGALFSGGIAIIALVLGRALGVKDGAGGKDASSGHH